jgi:hypothetical protein
MSIIIWDPQSLMTFNSRKKIFPFICTKNRLQMVSDGKFSHVQTRYLQGREKIHLSNSCHKPLRASLSLDI